MHKNYDCHFKAKVVKDSLPGLWYTQACRAVENIKFEIKVSHEKKRGLTTFGYPFVFRDLCITPFHLFL